jgi:hypothetical protein
VKGIQVCSNNGPGSLQRGEKCKNLKMWWDQLKIIFCRTTGPISKRLGTDHLWVEGFLFCANEGDCLSPRGENSERVKIH